MCGPMRKLQRSKRQSNVLKTIHTLLDINLFVNV